MLRRCPSCGRRFHIELVGKALVSSNIETIIENQEVMLHTFSNAVPTILVGREQFKYSYKCTRCGHQWTEERTEEHKGE